MPGNADLLDGMKRDGRSLDHKTLEEFRLMAVRVREGKKPSDVVKSLGMKGALLHKSIRGRPSPSPRWTHATTATGTV